MDETDSLELHKNLATRVAERLAKRPVLIRFRQPSAAHAAGQVYKYHGQVVVDIDPANCASGQLRIFLHEIAHQRLDFDRLLESNQVIAPAGSVKLSPAELAANKIAISPLDDRANEQAAAWLAWSDAHWKEHPTWSELRSRLISLLFWKP